MRFRGVETLARRVPESRNRVPAVPIDDPFDPRIEPFRALKATNATRGRSEFVVEGRKLHERLLASVHPLVATLACASEIARLEARLPPEAVLYAAPRQIISEIVGYSFHQGVLGLGRRGAQGTLEDLVQGQPASLGLVVAPRLTNPENLGSIARIADVLGCHGLVAGPSCPDPFSRRVLRVSMGAVLHLPVFTCEDPASAIESLARSCSLTLIGAVAQAGARPFYLEPAPTRFALVLGDEDRGLDLDWQARCNQLWTIPMRAGASSLNVANAAAILLEHLTRPLRSITSARD